MLESLSEGLERPHMHANQLEQTVMVATDSPGEQSLMDLAGDIRDLIIHSLS